MILEKGVVKNPISYLIHEAREYIPKGNWVELRVAPFCGGKLPGKGGVAWYYHPDLKKEFVSYWPARDTGKGYAILKRFKI